MRNKNEVTDNVKEIQKRMDDPDVLEIKGKRILKEIQKREKERWDYLKKLATRGLSKYVRVSRSFGLYQGYGYGRVSF